VILLLLAFGAGGMGGSNIWAITQTIAGQRWRAAGQDCRISGNLAGIIAPAVTDSSSINTGVSSSLCDYGVVAMLAALSTSS